VLGSFWAAHDYLWWEKTFISKGVKIFLPDIFGWIGGLSVNLLIILTLYFLVKKWEKRKV
jgi:hypothetical protein